MKLIASKKLNLVNSPASSLDAQAIRNSISTGTGQTFHVAMDDTEANTYIERMTRLGYTCHIFGYIESQRVVTTREAFKAA